MLQLLKDRAVWGALGIAVMLNTGMPHQDSYVYMYLTAKQHGHFKEVTCILFSLLVLASLSPLLLELLPYTG